ncbi:hypothetical protein TcCL_NonESM08466, partial [Trypanosoma cruzi]
VFWRYPRHSLAMKLHVGCQTLLPLAAVPAPLFVLFVRPVLRLVLLVVILFAPQWQAVLGAGLLPLSHRPPMTQRLSTFHPERIRFPDCRWRDCHPKRAMLNPFGARVPGAPP